MKDSELKLTTLRQINSSKDNESFSEFFQGYSYQSKVKPDGKYGSSLATTREALLADIPSISRTMIRHRPDWPAAAQGPGYQVDAAWCLQWRRW